MLCILFASLPVVSDKEVDSLSGIPLLPELVVFGIYSLCYAESEFEVTGTELR